MKKQIPGRNLLYLIALFAVLTDSMLIPFYPRFFELVYQEHSLLITGVFIAFCRIVMIISFPFWGWLAKRVNPLKILTYTQGMAGIICIICSFAGTLTSFFICSFLIELLKSSYLLIYPYLVKTSKTNNRAVTISGISIILNLGIVISTLLGGYFIEHFHPRFIFIIVGCMDILQMIISRYITKSIQVKENMPSNEVMQAAQSKINLPILCLISLFFYFSMVIVRPYFVLFLTSNDKDNLSVSVAALIFIIPNIVALFIAPFTSKLISSYPLNTLLIGSCVLMSIGLAMHIYPNNASIVIGGRIIYGTGMFLCEVIIDMLVFTRSTENNIYKYYSYLNVVQNISIVIAPLTAATFISAYGQYPIFLSAIAAILIMIILILPFCKKRELGLIKN
ncbi:MAG TPA: MFS transporter [Chitinophagales bacterium]|nr:MFS transporter [Chitinophagales bacterium]